MFILTLSIGKKVYKTLFTSKTLIDQSIDGDQARVFAAVSCNVSPSNVITEFFFHIYCQIGGSYFLVTSSHPWVQVG